MNNPTQLIPSVAEDLDLPQEMDQSRRNAIKQLALMCGLALSASSLSALAAVVTPPTDMNRSTKTLFNKSQLALVRELGEIIIPTTDTPGAIAAGVHDFINHYVVYCASKEEQQDLLTMLKRIDDSAQANAQKPFLLLTKEQQTELLNNMEQAKNGFNQTDRNGFKQLKALVLFGYYTSEIGATQELAYLAIPGGYKGNFKFKEIGKAWALPQ
ncbi:gluconate 2-dehydrogenase subunit 3 family protein [Cellvibrio mixtus]|uniref:gluconate 2-dehydrogenase subunit 3 family protein n=1 Tax=Cellvibrio mixtus TaxID=39650 RepID=UPI000694B861|nr:gluconate 2-dehydrogenase subunit 3 family protein [Cellvibrio mixtus]